MTRSKKFCARATCVLAIATTLLAGTGFEAVFDLAGRPTDPFAARAKARVFVFARIDCPVTNHYSAELAHITEMYRGSGVEFWLVYPGQSITAEQIRNHLIQFGFTAHPLRDPQRDLERRAHVTMSPEAAVFDASGRLVYHGRIDDTWVSPLKARQEAHSRDLEEAINDLLAGRPVVQPEAQTIGCPLISIK